MGEPSSDIGRDSDYRPPPKHPGQHSLLASYCTNCAAAEICGEHETETACADPAEYDSQDFHPATTPRLSLLQELTLPEPSGIWEPVNLDAALVIATDYRPLDHESFAVGARAVLRPARGEAKGRVAVLSGRDDVIHKFWRRRGSLGSHLASLGYRAAITPAYSTYWAGTPLEGLVSLRRTLTMAQLLQEHLPVVPTIPWRTGRDLERACEWLNAARVRTIAVHLGGRLERSWRWHLKGVEIIRRLLPHDDLRLVAIGPSKVQRIGELAMLWGPQLTIASQKPWLAGQNGRALDDGLTVVQGVEMKTREELLMENANTLAKVVEQFVKRRGLRIA